MLVKKKKKISLQRILVGSKIECKIHTECSSVHITCGVLEDGNLLKDSAKNPNYVLMLFSTFLVKKEELNKRKRLRLNRLYREFHKREEPSRNKF